MPGHANKPATPESVADQRHLIEAALDSLKAQDIVIINLAGKTSIADYMVVATATSSRHAASLADNVTDVLKKAGHKVFGSEGRESGEWVCLDAGAIIIHIFQPGARQLYNLEKLWSF